VGEEVGIPWPVAHDQAVRALERFIAGHWDDAIAEIDAAAGSLGVPGQTYTLILARSVLSLIRSSAGQSSAASSTNTSEPPESPGHGHRRSVGTPQARRGRVHAPQFRLMTA